MQKLYMPTLGAKTLFFKLTIVRTVSPNWPYRHVYLLICSSGMLKVFQWGKSHKSLSSIQSMLIFQCKNNFGTKQKWRITKFLIFLKMNNQERARLQNYSVLIAPTWATYVNRHVSRQSNLRQEHARVQSERNVKGSVNTNSSMVTWLQKNYRK